MNDGDFLGFDVGMDMGRVPRSSHLTTQPRGDTHAAVGRWTYDLPADPYLRTERLDLRRFTVEDLDALEDLDADPEVMRYITDSPAPPTSRA